MKITQLKDHIILKAVSTVSREYIVKCNPGNPKQNPMATRRERFAIETLLSIGSVVSCIDQLYFSVDMLSGYRANCMSNKMNRYDYIVFGIENYYLRLTSVFDRCLRLANVIYQLGFPERQCNNDSITKNFHVKGTPVAKALIELDKFTSPFRFHRNTVAHQDTYSDKELNELGGYYILVDMEENGVEQYQHFYKKMTDDFVTDKKIDFKNKVLNLESLVEAYFSVLETVFIARLESYV